MLIHSVVIHLETNQLLTSQHNKAEVEIAASAFFML
jgi:hypothetical protein